MDPKSIVGKALILPSLTPELLGRVARWVHDDNVRAQKAREERQKRKEEQRAQPKR
jgi:hypothetical protein